MLVVAVVTLGTTLGGTLTSQITIPGIESQRVSDLLSTQFPAANGGTLRTVFAASNGGTLNDQAAQSAITKSLNAAENVDGVINVSSLTVSPTGMVGFADVLFAQPPEQVPDSEKSAVKSAMQPARAAGLEVEYGGSAETTDSQVGGPGEIIGVVVAAIVLFITLRALITAGLPILTAIVGAALGPLVVRRPGGAGGQRGVDTGLVEEDELVGILPNHVRPPLLPGVLVPLGGHQRLFFQVHPSRASIRLMVAGLTCTPWLAAHTAHCCSSVASSCARSCATNSACCSDGICRGRPGLGLAASVSPSASCLR